MIAAALAFLATHTAWLLPALGGGGLVGLVVGKLGLRTIAGAIGARREWLILLAVAVAAAFLWWQWSTVTDERDRAREWRRLVCASVGVDPRAAAYRKGDCARRVSALAALERETLAASNQALARAIEEGRRKSTTDQAITARTAAEIRAAAETMERVNAQVGPDDRVDGRFFAGINGAAGLRRTP